VRDVTSEPARSVPRDQVGVAIASVQGGPIRVSGTLHEGQAWSAIKVPLAAALLDARAKAVGTADGASTLTARERAWLRRALTRSDNKAASRLFWRLAGGHAHPERGRARLAAMLHRAGDRTTRVRVQFGTTVWRLEDAVRVYRQLAAGCLLGQRDTRYLLQMMRQVQRSERWGVPQVAPRSSAIAFKGGWGPDSRNRWLVEQIAILGRESHAKVIAVMARSAHRARSLEDPSAFEAGIRLVERYAAPVVRTPSTRTDGAPTCAAHQ